MPERFLSRWARLKRERDQAAPEPPQAAPAAAGSGSEQPGAATLRGETEGEAASARGPGVSAIAAVERPDPAASGAPGVPTPGEPEAAPELPPIESLTPESDFRPFLRAGVAPETRNAALKKLFADPAFNVMDGLDVYIEDFGKTEPVPESMLRGLAQSRLLGLFEGAGADDSASREKLESDRSRSRAAPLAQAVEPGHSALGPNAAPESADLRVGPAPADGETGPGNAGISPDAAGRSHGR